MEATVMTRTTTKTVRKKVSKTWEAAQKYKGSIKVLDNSILD